MAQEGPPEFNMVQAILEFPGVGPEDMGDDSENGLPEMDEDSLDEYVASVALAEDEGIPVL